MMKFVLLTVAICFAVASAQDNSVTAAFIYKGSPDCSDAAKIARIEVVTVSACSPVACKLSEFNGGFATVTRCYNNITAVPIPSTFMTLNASPKTDCSSKATGAAFVLPGMGGCTPTASDASVYFSGCNSTTAGSMECTSSDCSTGCTASAIYNGKEGQCTTGGVLPLGYSFQCKVDFSGIADIFQKKSSATQVVMSAVGLVSIIALVL